MKKFLQINDRPDVAVSYNNFGLTLLEIILSVAMMAILFLAATPFFVGLINSNKLNNGVDVFILSNFGEVDTYVFKSNELMCHLIDFSNSVVNMKFLKNKVINQTNKVIHIFDKYSIQDYNIDKYFYILCLHDYIQLCNCLKNICTKNNIKKILDDIIDTSSKLIVNNLSIDGTGYIF